MIDTIEIAILKQVGTYKQLSSDEQRTLAQRAQAGDTDAREHLVECNLRLVVMCMKSYRQFISKHFEDLYQAGIIGLLQGIDHYDLSRGTAFSSCAVPWIHQSIKLWLHETQNMLYVPRYLHDAAIKVHQSMLRGCHGVGELADRTGLKPSYVEQAMQHLARSYVSLDAQVQQEYEAGYTWQEIIPDEEEAGYDAIAEQSEAQWMIEPLLAILKPRERQAIQLRFGLGFAQGREMTYPAIAQALHISTFGAFSLVRRAIEKMQHAAAGLNQEAKAS